MAESERTVADICATGQCFYLMVMVVMIWIIMFKLVTTMNAFKMLLILEIVTSVMTVRWGNLQNSCNFRQITQQRKKLDFGDSDDDNIMTAGMMLPCDANWRNICHHVVIPLIVISVIASYFLFPPTELPNGWLATATAIHASSHNNSDKNALFWTISMSEFCEAWNHCC